MRRLSLTLSQKGFLLVGIPLLFEVIFVAVFATLLHQADAEIDRINRARDIVETTDRIIQQILLGGEVVLRFRTNTERPNSKTRIDELIDRTEGDLAHLQEVAHGNKNEEVLIQRAQTVEQQLHTFLNTARSAVRKGSMLDNLDVFRHMHERMQPMLEQLSVDMRQLIEDEQDVAASLPAVQAKWRERVQSALAVGVLMNVCLAIALVLRFNRTTADRLRVLMDNTRRLAAGKPLNHPLEGMDELAQLDKFFNDMAKSLGAAMRKERAIIENASDVICAIDEDGKFVAVSHAASDVFGYEPEQLMGTNWEALLHGSDRADAAEILQRMRAAEKTDALELQIKRADGRLVDVLWSANWSETERTLYCIAHDVTARKEIERMKQEFVAMVSHDLRTPLASIQICLEMLEAERLGELTNDGKDFVTAAGANVNRLMALINDLLDIEKMESGKLQLNISSVQLSSIVEQTVYAVGGFASNQKVQLVDDIQDATVEADRDRLVQVLVNLVSNAVKFSPPNSTITLWARPSASEFEFKVIDQGRGIPPAMCEQVFERFQQVQASDATEKKGSGLGLAICRAIVECHGGTIGVESEVGKGSTFWFKIPSQNGCEASGPGRTSALRAAERPYHV